MKFRVQDVPGTGNCLFEAVGRTAQIDAAVLRRATVAWMRVPMQRLHGEELALWISNASEVTLGPDAIASYTSRMEKSGVWGGGIELAVMATLLHRPILVHASETVDPSRATRIAEFLPDDASQEVLLSLPAICILYVGRAHYMQLIPFEENK